MTLHVFVASFIEGCSVVSIECWDDSFFLRKIKYLSLWVLIVMGLYADYLAENERREIDGLSPKPIEDGQLINRDNFTDPRY